MNSFHAGSHLCVFIHLVKSGQFQPIGTKMSNLIIPKEYKPLLDKRSTEKAIKLVKDFFQLNLSTELKLSRVTAPLFVLSGLGINDDLNGVEHPVSFKISDMGGKTAEIVHSLAKWKRLTLASLDIKPGYGIYTDMNAVRADEELDNLHSLYVDQWDWEAVISDKQRSVEFLKKTVNRIYQAILRTQFVACDAFPQLKPFLPDEITFIHSEDLLEMYPGKSAKERENLAAKKYGAVFIIGIGGKLPDGTIHDGRAPDYDDWSTPTDDKHHGLNGDILIWYPVLERAFELSSMGIRVDHDALLRQLEITGKTEREKLYFHKCLLNGELPLSIGGGIGQSRLCMVMLQKAHIGEIQASIWPDEMRKTCAKNGIPLI